MRTWNKNRKYFLRINGLNNVISENVSLSELMIWTPNEISESKTQAILNNVHGKGILRLPGETPITSEADIRSSNAQFTSDTG